VAKKFVVANALNPEIAAEQFSSSKIYSEEELQAMGRCQVSDRGNADEPGDDQGGEKL
jgi:hypothetical protein